MATQRQTARLDDEADAPEVDSGLPVGGIDAPVPGSSALSPLTPFERSTFRLINWLYRNVPAVTDSWLRNVSARWMAMASRNMMFPVGLERIAGLKHSDGILLVSNHRSFFDLYMLLVLLQRFTPLNQRKLNPVRGEFFYQRWSGLLVNLIVGAGRMYPPFFRDKSKQAFNRWALDHVAAELRRGEVLVGFHPEGTRNKNASPYEPLEAQPGVGKLIARCEPIIVPAFINGLSNDIIGDIRGNFRKDKTVVAVFGEPIDGKRSRGWPIRDIAKDVLGRIYQLGDEERAYRGRLDEYRLATGDNRLCGATFRF